MKSKLRTDYLRPFEERVVRACLRSWISARKIAAKVGVKASTADVTLRRLRKRGIIEKVQIAPYGPSGYRATVSPKTMLLRRKRLAKAAALGVETLPQKLYRLLGRERAREAEQFFNQHEDAYRESNHQ